jgi:hypothetical protein
MLSDLQKARVRYHLDLMFAGTPLSSETLGLRTVTRAGELEAYMVLLQPVEESILLGQAYAAAQLYGPLVAGKTVSVTIGVTTVTYTITSGDLLQPSALFAVLGNFSALVNASAAGVLAVPGRLTSDKVMPGGLPPFGQLFMSSLAPFNASFAASTANVVQTANGTALPPPRIVTVDQGTGDSLIVNGVLPICETLETSFMSVDQRLAFNQAGAASTGQVIFNKMEMRQRLALYKYYVRKMAVLLSFSISTHSSVGHQAYGFPGS